jgi:hypothetical protein
MVPTITVPLVLQNELFTSLLTEVCVLQLQTPYHMSSHQHHFEICGCHDDPLQQAVAWCQIRAVHWIFQDFPPEVLQGVVMSWCDQAMSCRSKAPFISKKGWFCLMTALNCFHFVQHATTLIIVPVAEAC